VIKKYFKNIVWILLALLGALAFSTIALSRNESINAVWFITAAVCIYMIAYRFYASWIAAKVLVIDEHRKTPALRLQNDKDFIPTDKWIVFGHHFAAIAGPGPLVGPTLAAQFGYLPGMLWILIGAVLGGAVQDMTTLFFSTRRNGKSLGQMARDEIGVIGSIRTGRVLEASLIGFGLLLLAVFAGGLIDHSQTLRTYFDHDSLTLAWAIIFYGFAAAVLPVWLLLAPRDYLSTFVKLGTVIVLAVAIITLQPEIKMPALTQFTDGTGPIFGGSLFPFVFITIACGSISGFHSLIASGTTPKLLDNEKYIPMIGYGAMLLESFVAIMALIAATVLEPGIFFAINSPVGVVGSEAVDAIQKINSWGFKVTVEEMELLAKNMGETSLFARTGGAPSLAVGMANIFGKAFGTNLLAMWYHFAIMFEAIFILTTLDAGTRVGRFMLQDMIGNIYPKFGQTSWMPSIILSSAIVVSCWGYFLYIGVIDPNGGVNILWPLFGIANQMLAAIALSVGTGILIKSNKLKYAWVTGLPLIWLIIVTTTAAYQKIFSQDIRVGFLAAARDLTDKINTGLIEDNKISITHQLIFNQKLDAFITLFLLIILWTVVIDMLRISFFKKN